MYPAMIGQGKTAMQMNDALYERQMVQKVHFDMHRMAHLGIFTKPLFTCNFETDSEFVLKEHLAIALTYNCALADRSSLAATCCALKPYQ